MSYLMLMTGTGEYKVLCKLKIDFVHFHICQLKGILHIIFGCKFRDYKDGIMQLLIIFSDSLLKQFRLLCSVRTRAEKSGCSHRLFCFAKN